MMKLSQQQQLFSLVLVLMLVYFLIMRGRHAASAPTQLDYDKYRRILTTVSERLAMRLRGRVSDRAATVAEQCFHEYAKNLKWHSMLTNPSALVDASEMQKCLRQKAYQETPRIAKELLSAEVLPVIIEAMHTAAQMMVDDASSYASNYVSSLFG